MRQFAVYANPSERSRRVIPYFVAVQSQLLESNVAVVVPMIVQDRRSAFTHTSVEVMFADTAHIVLVGELTSVDARVLLRALGDLQVYEDDIRRALDRLFTGF